MSQRSVAGRIADIVEITGKAVILTEEEGPVSGDLDVAVDEAGTALVRYRDTDTWYAIGNLDSEPPRSWDTAAELAAAVEAGTGRRDSAGNAVPFAA